MVRVVKCIAHTSRKWRVETMRYRFSLLFERHRRAVIHQYFLRRRNSCLYAFNKCMALDALGFKLSTHALPEKPRKGGFMSKIMRNRQQYAFLIRGKFYTRVVVAKSQYFTKGVPKL